jgi:phage terminase large subunit
MAKQVVPTKLAYPPESWEPRPDQLPLWLDLQKGVPNILAITHRQWGKDELFLHAAGVDALERACTINYCLPKTVDVRKNVWDMVDPRSGTNRIDKTFPENIRTGKTYSMTIEWPVVGHPEKHSTIVFTGSDNHTGLRGQVGWIYNFSEWAYCDPHALAVVRPIIEANGGKMRFFTTAFGQNHAYRMLLDNARKPDWRCYLITNHTTHPLMQDARAKGVIHLQSHRISPERMVEITNENMQLYGPEVGVALTNQEYECSFEEIVPGSFYLDLIMQAERGGRICAIAPRPEVPVYAAFDLGFTDPTAVWYVQVKEEGWVDVLDFDEWTHRSIPEIIPDLKRKPWYYGELLVPHDGPHHEVTSGTTTEQILSAAGFRVRVMPQTNDETQIPSVRSLLPRCRFNNTPSVQRGLDCLRHFHNKAKMESGRLSWKPNPYHDWSSHAAKSFATLAYFAPELRAGVQTMASAPPVHPRYYGAAAGAQGWMR